ncbi:SNF2 family N-terminal domain-containing protein [Chytriomyces sp. MP71]|nr:SNF2 family N-terminal domain-containing protein [Chytriomyces sp. MP71]
MNSLLGQGGKLPYSGYLPNGSQKFWGVPKPGEEQFDVELDAFARPLREGEVAEQLKDLLENVAITAAVPAVEERLQSPPELKVTLLEHQKIGVEWMLKMERGSNKGGILADDMGLGKTIQSIACCILNRSQDKTKKATLIVAPTSLILQWREEIRTRVAGGTFKCLVYYGKDKKDIKSAPALNQYDIVITSYGTVTQEWPEGYLVQGSVTFIPEGLKGAVTDGLPCFYAQNHWHRVILDEAHTIKNKATRGARSCVQLVSTHRWCLTGTPIQNNIGELYSLINFLDIRPYCDWSKFRDDIERPFKLGKHKRVMKRVQALLKALCLRRTKNSMLDGRPIITLPEKRVEVVEADFSPSEREFYNSLEKKTLLKFNAYLREGTVMQNYSNVLVLLLRLRQACCHPSLVAQNFNEAPPELLEAAEASQARPLDPLEVLNGDIQERLLGMKLKSAYECPICFDALTDGKIIPACGHVFCGDCILGHVAAVGLNGADEEKTCPTCRGDIDVPLLVSVDAFLSAAKKVGMTADAEDVSTTVSNPQDGPGDDTGALSEKAKGKMPRQIRDRDLNDADEADDYGPDRSEWISSTKIDQMMAVVLKTRRENPGDKTIIFTQFRGMMDLCEKPLKENQIGFVRYDGSMSAEQRDNAVSTLQNDPDTNVILVSLKCGSLGLNLTCCNRVIIVDFWWNVAVENQAVDRVHRFGQTKPVFVHRISVKETVEQRILQLQHEKQELFNAALGEGGVKGLSRNRLGLQDLIKLFKGGLGGDVSDEEDA